MDPRIRERRIEVRRLEGRRRLRLLLASAGVAVAIAGGWGVTRSPLLSVHHIALVGAVHTSETSVLAATGLRRGEAVVDIDEGAASRRLDALPWVARASVRRQWPQGVRITLTERVPSAVVPGSQGTWALVDRSGQVLGPVLVPLAGLPVLAGLPPAGAPGSALGQGAERVLDVAVALTPALLARVAAVQPSPNGGVDLALRAGGIARLGGLDQLGEKLLAVDTVLSRVDVHNLAVLDVRVPGSPVLTRQ